MWYNFIKLTKVNYKAHTIFGEAKYSAREFII